MDDRKTRERMGRMIEAGVLEYWREDWGICRPEVGVREMTKWSGRMRE